MRQTDSTPSRKSVLLVEDDVELRTMLRHVLGIAGYAVRETGDGINALRLVELERPDLIVLDLGLPLLSGLNVQQEIAAHARTRSIPVVIITGSAASLAGLDVACVLRKPVSPEDVVAVVRRCLAAVMHRRDSA
jgi:DNA-binding response OmpR family regulator